MSRYNYNRQAAEELVNDFCEITKLNIFDNSRSNDKASFRALLYKVLNELNGMNDRMISDWFAEKGVKRNRSSIFHALKKIDVYYDSFTRFRVVYDIYFDDKKEETIRKERARLERLKNKTKAIKQIILNKEKDALALLIDTIPDNKRDDIYEMVNLRVKSWEWKSKDKCEVIECGTSMEGMHW